MAVRKITVSKLQVEDAKVRGAAALTKSRRDVKGCLCPKCKNGECMHNPLFWKKYKVTGWPEPSPGEGCQGD